MRPLSIVVRRARTIIALLSCCMWFPLAAASQQSCGGTERWAVKVGADPAANLVSDVNNPVVKTVHELVTITKPALPPQSDNVTRLPQERTVFVVDARLMQFKREAGKKPDEDFHLVMSDASQQFSPGGAGTVTSAHSFIAEIVDPSCIAGENSTVTGPSQFQAQLAAVRAKFMQQFPQADTTGEWNETNGLPVRITGVGFFDRPHGQTGRALNGIELHPVLDIDFNPGTPTPPPPGNPAPLLQNPGFEEGATGWTATAEVISNAAGEAPHSGTFKAWLGGYGETHTDRLSQRVDIPSTGTAATLKFFLHISTEEQQVQAFDKMRVRVKSTSGQVLATLKTYTNLQAAPGFSAQMLDLSAFRGRSVRIEFEAVEDNGLRTSFVVDDVEVIIE